ncbi:hypothetical protein LTR84_009094 [Exophiala bonariae]|uniref:Uncharacterized protein n=1 Tax=Exophiala bonariae TaxID=1690606 RepID=A0AAV9MWS3_9EURO|nr:hypothetical protein LTR84_009094 [Exophiala bonariae]
MFKYSTEIEEAYALSNDPPERTVAEVTLIKKIIELYIAAFKYGDSETVSKLRHPQYKQHNPDVWDRLQGLVGFATMQQLAAQNSGQAQPPAFKYKRFLRDGDFLTIHMHVVRWPGD